MKFEKYLNVIDRQAEVCCGISDALWDHPEVGYQEYEAVKILTKTLEEAGFTIRRELAGIPTAFSATFGTGKPAFGILAEYDALPGMSQEAYTAEQRSVPGKDTSHGCGHNLFAGGSVAAALAVKAYIEEKGCGSVTLFGCPAEEGGGGKVFLAKAGVFDGIDAIVSWHPESMYMVRTRPALANYKVDYFFEGVAAHAGAAPEKGRSALDALELMNIGVNFLREHMELTSRIHYAILDTGGTAPNMVQSHASVRYMIRSVDLDTVRNLFGRVNRIAQGAAMMTDTTVTSKVYSAYSNLITIPTLQATANEALHDIPIPTPTEEDLAYAEALQATMNLTDAQKKRPPYALKALEPAPPVAHGGSTDTADVSWVCPTVQMHIGTWMVGTPGHSWQAVSQCKSPYAKRAMLFAGKAVAGTILRLFENPELVRQAKEEHWEKTEPGYVCPLPDGVTYLDTLAE